jgi:hypothetical protein
MSNLSHEIRRLRAEIAQLRAEIAELRARPPVVYQPVWVAPTMPMPTWDPLRPYCAPLTPAHPAHWPTVIANNCRIPDEQLLMPVIASSGDASRVHALLSA